MSAKHSTLPWKAEKCNSQWQIANDVDAPVIAAICPDEELSKERGE